MAVIWSCRKWRVDLDLPKSNDAEPLGPRERGESVRPNSELADPCMSELRIQEDRSCVGIVPLTLNVPTRILSNSRKIEDHLLLETAYT